MDTLSRLKGIEIELLGFAACALINLFACLEDLPIFESYLKKLIEIATAHEMGHSFLGLKYGHSSTHNHLMSHSSHVLNLDELDISSNEARIISQSRYIHYTLPKPITEFIVDINNDGKVDLEDTQIVRDAINGKDLGYDTDINNDGVTDEADINIVKLAAMQTIITASPTKRKITISTWGKLKTVR